MIIRIIGLCPKPKGNSSRIVRARSGFPRLIPSKSATACQAALVAMLQPYAINPPLDCPLRRDAVFYLPIPKHWPKWKKKAALECRFLPAGGGRQADTGNLVKLLDDALEKAGILANDGQIVGGECVKLYSAEPGYLVRLTNLAQAERSTPAGASNIAWWQTGLHQEGAAPTQRDSPHQEKDAVLF